MYKTAICICFTNKIEKLNFINNIIVTTGFLLFTLRMSIFADSFKLKVRIDHLKS